MPRSQTPGRECKKHQTWCVAQMTNGQSAHFGVEPRVHLKKKKPSTKTLEANLWFILILALIHLVVLFYKFMSSETHLFNFTTVSLVPRTASGI